MSDYETIIKNIMQSIRTNIVPMIPIMPSAATSYTGSNNVGPDSSEKRWHSEENMYSSNNNKKLNQN